MTSKRQEAIDTLTQDLEDFQQILSLGEKLKNSLEVLGELKKLDLYNLSEEDKKKYEGYIFKSDSGTTANIDYLMMLSKYLYDQDIKKNQKPPFEAKVVNLCNISHQLHEITKFAAFLTEINRIAEDQKQSKGDQEVKFNFINKTGFHIHAISIRVLNGKIKIFCFDSIQTIAKNPFELVSEKFPGLKTMMGDKIEYYSISELYKGQVITPLQNDTYSCGEFACNYLKIMDQLSSKELEEISRVKDIKDMPHHFVKTSQSILSLEYGLEGKKELSSNPKKKDLKYAKTIKEYLDENLVYVLNKKYQTGKLELKLMNFAILKKIVKHQGIALKTLKSTSDEEFKKIVKQNDILEFNYSQNPTPKLTKKEFDSMLEEIRKLPPDSKDYEARLEIAMLTNLHYSIYSFKELSSDEILGNKFLALFCTHIEYLWLFNDKFQPIKEIIDEKIKQGDEECLSKFSKSISSIKDFNDVKFIIRELSDESIIKVILHKNFAIYKHWDFLETIKWLEDIQKDRKFKLSKKQIKDIFGNYFEYNYWDGLKTISIMIKGVTLQRHQKRLQKAKEFIGFFLEQITKELIDGEEFKKKLEIYELDFKGIFSYLVERKLEILKELINEADGDSIKKIINSFELASVGEEPSESAIIKLYKSLDAKTREKLESEGKYRYDDATGSLTLKPTIGADLLKSEDVYFPTSMLQVKFRLNPQNPISPKNNFKKGTGGMSI